MRYLLDTNILLSYIRQNSISEQLEERYGFVTGDHELFISIVSCGELDSISKKANWGKVKLDSMTKILVTTKTVGINYTEVVEAYGDIDAYSQGKIPATQKFSARNMGKNDLWIAATAKAFNLPLVTLDRDFDHLGEEIIDLQVLDI